jgi:hypothetical protein
MEAAIHRFLAHTLLATLGLAMLVRAAPGLSAESTTGTIVGTVDDAAGRPVANARIVASAPSGRYPAVSDARGRFSLFGLIADTYAISVAAPGYQATSRDGVTVLPGGSQHVAFTLLPALKTIATVRSTARSFTVGSTSDTFTVSGNQARASEPSESASGLANYTQGTVQGAVSAVPGVAQDSFANVILRGGKIDDAVFDYDSVPIPQGLVAEPGGNIAGAQLFTTGVGSTTTTLAGFGTEGQNALGGVIDQIPSVGSYPGSTIVEVADGARPLNQFASFRSLWATPDLRWRYALAGTAGSQYLAYGDGTTFYPTEAGTYGVGLQTQGQFSLAGNVHFQADPHDDVSLVALFGEANYDQYGSPFPGETYGLLNGAVTEYPGVADQSAQSSAPSGVRGTYDVLKAQWVHTRAHSLERLQIYQTQFGSHSAGAFWDDNAFPDGSISLVARQGGREAGFSYDVDDVENGRNQIKFGVQYTTNTSFLDQVVPTADEYIASNPTILTTLVYAGDTWSVSRRLDVTGTLRTILTHVVPSDGAPYDDNFIDPHVSASYSMGDDLALRATFDHTSVVPKPLEADRTDSANPAPFVALAPETANDFTYSLEGGGKTQFRLTYFAEREMNRIDVLPVNFRSVVNSGSSPSGVGVPTNAGRLDANGLEFWVKRGGLTLDANYLRAYSSSASQFAFNGLNAAAVAAGHLFPVGYVPDFSAIASYELDLRHGRVRITPSLSYESGYPYGNGSMIWTFDARNKPVLVPNDNHVNPGYNYYFLLDPQCPLDEVPAAAGNACVPGRNPYIANLGTGEGANPNTLRTTPQALTSLHVEDDVSPRLTAVVDVVNLFGVAAPTQMQGNPYLIGPPGYAGGNAAYSSWYARQVCPGGCPAGTAYPYGNGVPTNYFSNTPEGENPIRQALPWTYGRDGYVPEAYPLTRSLQFRLRYRL